MPPLKTLLAASLLLISCLPGAANAGLYSSDKNNFGILKTNLTDAPTTLHRPPCGEGACSR